jgi:EAL domain-containing protein (putative c-di-GMP-specific phosphodiesterase class I)
MFEALSALFLLPRARGVFMFVTTPLIQRLLKRLPAQSTPHPLQVLLEQGKVDTVYQPIISLQSGAIEGHEATARHPKPGDGDAASSALLPPEQLAELEVEYELACMDSALQNWGYPHSAGRLHMSLSARTLVALDEASAVERLQELFLANQVSYKRIVIQVTQHRKLEKVAALERSTTALQALGCHIALDDVKASQRSLDLWLRLKPAVVKLDSRMGTDLQQDPAKAKVLRTLSNLAFKTGATLVAKAIDSPEDLRIVRDAGVHLAQGNFLGFAAPAVVDTLNLRARNVLAETWTPAAPPAPPGEAVMADSGLMGLRAGQQWFD